MSGRYRIGARVRGILPFGLTWIAPKGRHSCGAHEWHRADQSTWRCYHCEPGITHRSPFSPAEQLRHEIEAMLGTVRYLGHQPPSRELVEAERALAAKIGELATAHASMSRV